MHDCTVTVCFRTCVHGKYLIGVSPVSALLPQWICLAALVPGTYDSSATALVGAREHGRSDRVQRHERSVAYTGPGTLSSKGTRFRERTGREWCVHGSSVMSSLSAV